MRPESTVCIFVMGLGLALCAAGVTRAQPVPPDATGQPIVGIELDCAAPIDRQGLLQILPVHVGNPLAEDGVEATRARLLQTHIFTDVSIEVRATPGGVVVVAHLVREVILNALRFRGNHTLGDDELRRVARLHEGTALTDELRDGAVTRLRERYVAQGFETVRVTSVVVTRSPGEVDLTIRIHEGPPLEIVAIEIDGELPIGVDELRKALPISVGDRFVAAERRTAQAALVARLRREGYYEADVEATWARGAGYGGTLRFTVQPGPRFTVRFTGNRRFKSAELLALMELAKRPIITDGTWRELARRAQRAYQEDGYYFARVTVRIDTGPPRQVHFDVSEGERYHVVEVRVEGNRALSAGMLRASMATRRPSWIPWRRGFFLDDVFDDDLKRLWYLYRRHGFEAAQIVDARTHFDASRGEVSITVYIEEGRQTIVRAVERSGLDVVGETPTLQTRVGEPLDPEAVDADRRTLLSALAQAGYAQAEVAATVTTATDGDGAGATVRFVARPGTAQRVGTIVVQNNVDTRSRVIVRELPFASGDPLNPEALVQGQTNVYRLGLFRSVNVRPVETPAEGETRDVTVDVSEKPAGTMQWGAGYNTRDGLRGFLEVGYANLQGLARRLSLRGEFSYNPGDSAPNEYVGTLGFREPRLGNTKWRLRMDLLAQRSTRSVDQFSLERFAFIPAIERTILPGLEAGFETQVEQAHVFDVKPDVLAFNPRDEGDLRTISVGPFAVYDRRDDPFVPRRGTSDSLRVRFAPRQLGSDIPLVKVIGQHSHYVPLNDDFTFVYATRAGWARAYEGHDQVPIRERFFLGGRTTVRGFDENSIGPEGSLGDPLGGDLVLNLNGELRFPLAFGLGGAVFTDGGGVYLQERAISIHDFRRSAGLGLRYITPVGPLSLDYGFKLDRRQGESVGEVHFSIGTIF